MNEPKIYIDASFDGFLIPLDLLTSEGTLQFSFNKKSKSPEGFLFHIESENFVFSFGYKDNSFVLRRNNVISVLTLDDLDQSNGLLIFAIWDHSEIKIFAGKGEGNNKAGAAPTPPEGPPQSLIKWARKQGMLPTETFITTAEFRQKVHHALSTISQKVSQADAYKSFWNIVYDRRKISQRVPKTEPELQPLLQCLISDQMLVSDIEVIPEAHSGAGNVDFLLVANIDGKLEKICIEVKLAHAQDLDHGYLVQLPEYMRYHEASYGIYCVLNFKGEWFEKPDLNGSKDVLFHLAEVSKDAKVPELNIIRPFEIWLAKPVTASRK
jgi:hypothetical protein